jgi:hypothetical protein
MTQTLFKILPGTVLLAFLASCTGSAPGSSTLSTLGDSQTAAAPTPFDPGNDPGLSPIPDGGTTPEWTLREQIFDNTSNLVSPETAVVLAYNTSPSAVWNTTTLNAGLDSFLNALRPYNIRVSAVSLNKRFENETTLYSSSSACTNLSSTNPGTVAPYPASYAVCRYQTPPDPIVSTADSFSDLPASLSDAVFAQRKLQIKDKVAEAIGAPGQFSDNFCRAISTFIRQTSSVAFSGRPLALAIISNEDTTPYNLSSCYDRATTVKTLTSPGATSKKLKINYTRTFPQSASLNQKRTFSSVWNRLDVSPTTGDLIQVPISPAQTTSTTCSYNPSTLVLTGSSATNPRCIDQSTPALTPTSPRPCTAGETANLSESYGYPAGFSCTVSTVVQQVAAGTGTQTNQNTTPTLAPVSAEPTTCTTAFLTASGVNYTSAQAYLNAQPKPAGNTWTCTSVEFIPAPPTATPVYSNQPTLLTGYSGGSSYPTALNNFLVGRGTPFHVSMITNTSACANNLNPGSSIGSNYQSFFNSLTSLAPGKTSQSAYCNGNFAAALDPLAQFVINTNQTTYQISWYSNPSFAEQLLGVDFFKNGVWGPIAGVNPTIAPLANQQQATLYLNVAADSTALQGVTQVRVRSRYLSGSQNPFGN